jgi:cell division protein FtsA
VRDELRRSGFEEAIAAGIVLTGGSARMEGAIELAEEIFHMPVRLGVPQGVKGLSEVVNSPAYATAVGLLLYARENSTPTVRSAGLGDGVNGALQRMKGWFKGSF